MKIYDDHLYHGSALIQIAEHPQFTAINALKLGKRLLRVACRINDDIAVYFKYASKPTPAYKEYPFTFTKEHLAELSQIAKATPIDFHSTGLREKPRDLLPYSCTTSGASR